MELWQRSAAGLAATLARREASAREILLSLFSRIERCEGSVHAFTDVLRERALAEADACDARRRAGRPRSALDGVPVSVKECFDVAGKPTTVGMPAWREDVAPRDATMIEALRAAGAVVFARTNLSQSMLFVEARNPVFGQTANPWSLAHSPGGSSGGESAAIAAGMSPLGVGTDIGGSIRTPCSFTGICGIKPTLDRLPMAGYRPAVRGQESVRAMGGPMARTVGDLALFFASLDPAGFPALDPRVPPVAWTDPASVDVRAMRVGTYADDGVLAASAAVVRAVRRAGEALAAAGCAVVDFAPPDMREVLAMYLGVLSADGGRTLLAALSGHPVDAALQALRRAVALPRAARWAGARAARLAGQPSTAELLEAIGRRTVADFWRLTARISEIRAELLARMNDARVDVLVCPAYATPAFPHGESRNFTFASSYSILFNATQLPAGVVPVTRVRQDETRRARGRAPGDAVERKAAAIDARSAGLPAGVQVVGRPWQDHAVLAAMAAIEAAVASDGDFPRTPVDPQATSAAPTASRAGGPTLEP
jgi:fatty acid amide hydrolase